ncbi:P pilus assembly protein, chaperone PapD [Kosakonia arachidis]|uniref:P pilus assembly protein, chaperone PapD n=2 Tax=Kosakonia arachidis TaxID=551989 RepID=A0A1I7E9Q8_9ENTR|nr:P pilus assembly protein, chaperone PapD [Kosakonia arachidis]
MTRSQKAYPILKTLIIDNERRLAIMFLTFQRYSIACILINAMFFISFAYAEQPEQKQAGKTKIEQKTTSYSVGISTTRIIYDPESSGASVGINNPNDYPVLAMSETFTEDSKDKGNFTVVPPLFRLDGNQNSRVRIIHTSSSFPADRESLNWFCVTGIPPEKGDQWDEGSKKEVRDNKAFLDIRVKLKQCIKILVRPAGIKGRADEAPSKVTWKISGKEIIADNPTGYYINLKMLSVGSSNITEPEYIPPFGSKKYTLPAGTGSSREIKFTSINDLGGVSATVSPSLH